MTKYEDYLIRTPFRKNKKAYYFDKFTTPFIKSKKTQINPKKFLIVRNDHIGDMLISTHVFKRIKDKYPESKITVIADPVNKVFIEKDPNVDNILVIDLFWRRKNIKALLDYLKILKKIRNEKFDVGIDLRRSLWNIIFFLYIPGIKSRISHYNINGGKAFLTHPVKYVKKTHYLKEYNELLRVLDVNPEKHILPYIATDIQDEKEVDEFLKENDLKDYIIICPGSTAVAKQWPEERYKELIKKFHKKYPKFKIILASGNSDKDLIDRLSINKKCFPLLGYNLRKMLLIFKKAKLSITTDGGVREIASISGSPLISLEGPVDDELWEPFRAYKVIRHKLPCYPCWSLTCEKPHGKWCMELITVDEVMDVIDEIVNLKNISKR